jgi:hypothetical protein
MWRVLYVLVFLTITILPQAFAQVRYGGFWGALRENRLTTFMAVGLDKIHDKERTSRRFRRIGHHILLYHISYIMIEARERIAPYTDTFKSRFCAIIIGINVQY